MYVPYHTNQCNKRSYITTHLWDKLHFILSSKMYLRQLPFLDQKIPSIYWKVQHYPRSKWHDQCSNCFTKGRNWDWNSWILKAFRKHYDYLPREGHLWDKLHFVLTNLSSKMPFLEQKIPSILCFIERYIIILDQSGMISAQIVSL